MSKKLAVKQKNHNLVIVESPAKAKTIEKYLGSDYVVKASMGHLIDLPKSRLAIDTEHGFQPEYITVRGRAKLLKELQQDAKNAKHVFLASDNDREGEAIAYHLYKAIREKCETVPVNRIVFNEVTPQAIKVAVQNPMHIDEAKVNAQKARRILDRLVGYNLSPLLWQKVKNGLSAGRVQSVALRLICEREKEVEAFIPEEFWTLEGSFKKNKASIVAQLALYQDKKPILKTEQDVKAIIAHIQHEQAIISEIKKTEKAVHPKPPFTTSTLQQAAANRLGFTSRKTMQIAQQLYEGVAVGSNRIGLITYMRTDSVRISNTALNDVRTWIAEHHAAYLPEKPIVYAIGAKAQDAHEGIRPTYTAYTPDYLKDYLNRDQLKLYTIIWERFTASQMTNAKMETVSFEITVGEALFRAAFTKVTEAGFFAVLNLLLSREEKGKAVPAIKKGDTVEINSLKPEQHFTQGPARYTDATIVKMLEQKGIGRPSTYAPIISVLFDRYYVNRSNKQLVPTQLGRIINDILVENFNDIIDVNFTAGMEQKLDAVEEQKTQWAALLESFYTPFIKRVDSVMEHLGSIKGSLDEPTEFICEKCGKKMVKKLGRFGFFLACSGFPECHNAKSIPLAKCPRKGCNGDIIARKAKGRGKEFYGCTNFPGCTFISHFKPINATCPRCGWLLV